MKKKLWPNLQRITELFNQKIVIKPSKILVWDPGFGKNLFRIRLKNAPDPGSATLKKSCKSLCLLSYFSCHLSILLPLAERGYLTCRWRWPRVCPPWSRRPWIPSASCRKSPTYSGKKFHSVTRLPSYLFAESSLVKFSLIRNQPHTRS